MNPEQYKDFCPKHDIACAPGLTDLVDRSPRTLIFGHAPNRAMHHVYIGQDGFIHAFRYAPLVDQEGVSPTGLDFLVLKHTYGEAGGMESAQHYVQGKRVYPALSDYEFCTLLKGCGVDLLFARYPENTPQQQRYSGETHDRGRSEKGVELVAEVREQLNIPEMAAAPASLAYRVVRQAVREVAAPHAVHGMDLQVYVAESAVAQVLERVASYLFEMHDSELLDVDVSDLLSTAFGATNNLNVESKSERFGCVGFEITSFGPAPLVGPGYLGYASRSTGSPAGAVVGSYRGRPYIVYGGHSGKYNVQLCQFGDATRFLHHYLKQHPDGSAA